MDTSVRMLNGGEVGAILLVFMVLVLLTEMVSWLVRRSLQLRLWTRKPVNAAAVVGVAGAGIGRWLAAGARLGWRLRSGRAVAADWWNFSRPTSATKHLLAVAKAGWETLVLSVDWGRRWR